MSSLWKPFSVSEGPCSSLEPRRGCSEPARFRTQNPNKRLGAEFTGVVSRCCLPGGSRLGPPRRVISAAAIGGKKTTHPGKAILAGTGATHHPSGCFGAFTSKLKANYGVGVSYWPVLSMLCCPIYCSRKIANGSKTPALKMKDMQCGHLSPI